MAIDYPTLKNWRFDAIEQSYTERDTMLYALGIGYGSMPLDPHHLRFVYERELQAVPSMATVLAHPGLWMADPAAGVNVLKLVHGQQALRLHRMLPASGTVIGQARVAAVIDKGAGKGALLVVERTLTEKHSGALLATVTQTSFCRADGGFDPYGLSDGHIPNDAPANERATPPDRPPDAQCDIATRTDMALLYRLSGDRNPLHADPAVAAKAGFSRPILHGLATYGIACRAILALCCDHQPQRLLALDAQFSAPVMPGETVRIELWHDNSQLFFQARVLGRDVLVLRHGRAVLAGTGNRNGHRHAGN